MTLPTYTQPRKGRVREVQLRRAVESLTVHRSEAAVVRAAEFNDMLAYAAEQLLKYKVGDAWLWTRPEGGTIHVAFVIVTNAFSSSSLEARAS
jgi:hypothetical protein